MNTEHQVFGVIAEVSFINDSLPTIENICLTNNYHRVTYFYVDEEEGAKVETVNMNNIRHFIDIKTHKELTVDEVLDDYSKRVYSMSELADLERHNGDKVYQ